MKKVLFGLLALSTFAFADNLYLKAGVDFNNKFDQFNEMGINFTEKDTDGTGFELGFEYTREIAPNLEFGFGLSYQNHDTPETSAIPYEDWDYGSDINDIIYLSGNDKFKLSDFKSVPLYLTLKYNLPVNWAIKPYIKADFGYSFNSCGDASVTWTDYEKLPDGTVSNTIYDQGSESFVAKVKDGIYYGIGLGVEYENFFGSLMYKVNTAELSVDSEDSYDNPYILTKDMDYSRFTFEFGYKFNF